MPKRSTLTKEEKKAIKKEYDKLYYESHKEGWNPTEKKKCECGHEVLNLTSHRKTRLHQDIMRFISEAKVRESLYNPATAISSLPSFGRPASTIGLGLGLSSR